MWHIIKPMLHRMKLQTGAFELVENGVKTLELRLYDDKRKAIQLHDVVEFLEVPNFTRKVRVKVTGLLVYPTFASIVDDLPARLMGYRESEKTYLRTSMYEVYGAEDEARYGALGIRFIIIKGGYIEKDNLDN